MEFVFPGAILPARILRRAKDDTQGGSGGVPSGWFEKWEATGRPGPDGVARGCRFPERAFGVKDLLGFFRRTSSGTAPGGLPRTARWPRSGGGHPFTGQEP